MVSLLLTFRPRRGTSRSPPLATDTASEEREILGTPQARRALHWSRERGLSLCVEVSFCSSERRGRKEEKKEEEN